MQIPLEVAIAFCEGLLERPRAVLLQPSGRYWPILIALLQCTEIRGSTISGVHLTALAIEHVCDLVTTDGDFARSPG